MDTTSGYADFIFGYAPSPNTRSYRAGGLPGQDIAGGGLPENVMYVGPSGDAGEGTLLLQHLGVRRPELEDREAGGQLVNHDAGFTPVPGVLPGEKHLNYARTFTVTTLLAIGIVFMLVKLVRDPSGAARLVGEGAKRQAGVK